jgi:hypothetical protein
MDVYIATGNIKNFNSLLLTEKDEAKRLVLLGLLDREKDRLATAVAAQAEPPAQQRESCSVGGADRSMIQQ